MGNRLLPRPLRAGLIFACGYAAAYGLNYFSSDLAVNSLSDGGGDKEIESFVRSYFDTWNKQNWDAYASHFSDRAVIYYNSGDNLTRMDKEPFIRMQEAAVTSSKIPLTEVAENVVIETDKHSASVVAYWKLTRGARVRRGVDRFSLEHHQDAGWKIISLYYR